MSTSILYHAFGLEGINHKSTKFIGNKVVFTAEIKDHHVKCPNCGRRRVIFKGQKTRQFIMSLLGRKKCILNLTLHRLRCANCNNLWWPHLSFMIGKHRFTRSFANTVLDLLQFGTIQSVAHYFGVSWDLIKQIHKSKLQVLYRRIPLHKIKYIGIDEFSLREGHNYMTVFTDLPTGRILHAVEGKSKEDIRPFLEKLAKRAKNLEAVAMDMSSSFFWAVSETLPHVEVVFDRYHVVALMNRGIDDLRRDLQNELEGLDQKILKGTRFLLLRNYDSLAPDRKARLDALFQANYPLYLMHSMKEQLRLLWEKEDRESAQKFLIIWCQDAMQSGIKQLIKIAKSLSAYRSGLLNYFNHHITSGAVEGLVNKIKTLKRQAYGFRDMEYFKLRLYHLHTQRYSLTG